MLVFDPNAQHVLCLYHCKKKCTEKPLLLFRICSSFCSWFTNTITIYFTVSMLASVVQFMNGLQRQQGMVDSNNNNTKT